MTKIISYWDEASKTYKEVSTLDPFPTTAVGGGAGGSEQVSITSANGDAKTGQYVGVPNSDIGLLTNARLLAQDGNAATNSVMLQAFPAGSDALLAADILLQTAARQVIFNGTTWDRARSAPGAADGGNGIGLPANAIYGFNGVTWDRTRNNMEGTLLASAARTVTTSSPNQTNHNSRGVIIYLTVTANPGGAETLKVSLIYIDPVSGAESSDIASNTTVAATNGLYTLQIYPSTLDTTDSQANNATYSTMLPRTWKATVTPSAAGSFTYSLGYSLIL